jgi:hypothetical protein
VLAQGPVADLQHFVVVGDLSDINSDRSAGKPARVDAGVLQRFPTGFKQQALLRVEQEGLAPADPEEKKCASNP